MPPFFVAFRNLARAANKHIWLPYSIIALLVLGPLLKPGYILTLDMVFTPHLRLPTSSSNDYLFRMLLYALHFLVTSSVIEKAILFTVLLLSGLGMHRLVRYVQKEGPYDGYYVVGAYIAGLFYMINPFSYDRFMAGQYEVLLGYSLLPWFVRSLLQYLANPGATRVFWLVLCSLVISIVSIHDIGLMAILSVVAGGTILYQHRADSIWQARFWKFSLLAIGSFALLSSYWIVPLGLGKGSVATQISSISALDQTAFKTVGGNNLVKVGNVARLQGFWVESRAMYELPQDRLRAWGLVGIVIWALVITGEVNFWRERQRGLLLMIAGSACIAGLIAIGILDGWPMTHIPLLAGYREPEKFVALIALAYAFFIARGATVTLRYCRRHGGKGVYVIVIAALVLPIAWTPTMVWGFAGQLQPVNYPMDWTNINTTLKGDTGNFQTLFLPWHLYMRFNFAGRIIANPAATFFDKPVIISDNPEFEGAALSKPTATKRTLDNMLPRVEYQNDFGQQLANLHIKYIIVDKDDDFHEDTVLSHQHDLQLITRGTTLDLYRNLSYQGE